MAQDNNYNLLDDFGRFGESVDITYSDSNPSIIKSIDFNGKLDPQEFTFVYHFVHNLKGMAKNEYLAIRKEGRSANINLFEEINNQYRCIDIFEKDLIDLAIRNSDYHEFLLQNFDIRGFASDGKYSKIQLNSQYNAEHFNPDSTYRGDYIVESKVSKGALRELLLRNSRDEQNFLYLASLEPEFQILSAKDRLEDIMDSHKLLHSYHLGRLGEAIKTDRSIIDEEGNPTKDFWEPIVEKVYDNIDWQLKHIDSLIEREPELFKDYSDCIEMLNGVKNKCISYSSKCFEKYMEEEHQERILEEEQSQIQGISRLGQ